MKKLLILIISLSYSLVLIAQGNKYVNADNGLIVREKPTKNSERIGKLQYGSEVFIIEESGIKFQVKDNNKIINGQWVNVGDINSNVRGFVFDGYLTSNTLSKRLKINFKDLKFQIELNVWDEKSKLKNIQKDTVNIFVSLIDSPLNKKITIEQSKFKKVEIFQRLENSISIMNEGPHCDLTNWKHYYSDWKKLPYNKEQNHFLTEEFKDKEQEKFINVSINQLKKEVFNKCGERWSNLIENIKDVNEYPSSVGTSRIFLKIILTDQNELVTEKMLIFEIPMGC